jgi:hypothetical protein
MIDLKNEVRSSEKSVNFYLTTWRRVQQNITTVFVILRLQWETEHAH